MIRLWPNLLLAALLAGLLAYVYWIDLPAERLEAEQHAEASRLLPFSQEQITEVAIQSPTVEVTLVRQGGQRWRITDPVQAEADQAEVGSLVRALVLGKVTRVVEEQPADLAPFGLEKPAAVLTVTADGQRQRLALGDSGPITSTLYALRDPDQQVLLTSLVAADLLNKTLRSFRKKELLTFEQDAVERVRLTYPQTEYVLYRTGRGPKETWELRFPIEQRADEIAVKQLLYRLESLKAVDFIDPGPEYSAIARALDRPRATITLHIAGRDHVLRLFQPESMRGQAFARAREDGPIYRINPLAVEDVTKDLFALRDKRLLGMSVEELASLDVRTRTNQYVLVKRNGAWLLEDSPQATLKKEIVDLFVSRVVNLPAEIQVLKRAGPLAPYGLAAPRVDFRATSRQGTTARLILGNAAGGLVYAKGGGLPGIYQARTIILDQIPSRQALVADGPQAGARAP